MTDRDPTPGDVAAREAQQPPEQPADEPAQQPTEPPGDQPPEEPARQPTDEPTDEPAEEPAEEPAGGPDQPPPQHELVSSTPASRVAAALGMGAAVGAGVAAGGPAAVREGIRGSGREHGVIEEEDSGGSLSFQFNPTDLTYRRTAVIRRDRKPKKDARREPSATSKGLRPTTVSFTLLFDGTTSNGTSMAGTSPVDQVHSSLEQLYVWTQPQERAQEQGRSTKPSPPVLVFSWGNLRIDGSPTFRCYLRSLDVTISMFTPEGRPLRATAKLDLEGLAEATPRTNPTSGTERADRRHTLLPGQTLQSVAFSELGDAGAWRVIAEMNGVDNPTRLRPGTELLIPRRPHLLGTAGGPRALRGVR